MRNWESPGAATTALDHPLHALSKKKCRHSSRICPCKATLPSLAASPQLQSCSGPADHESTTMSSKAREDWLPKYDGELSFLQHLFLLLSSRKCCKCQWLQTPEISTNAEATTHNTTWCFYIIPFPLTGKDGKPEETVQVTHGAGTQSRAQIPMPLPYLHIPEFLECASKICPAPC